MLTLSVSSKGSKLCLNIQQLCRCGNLWYEWCLAVKANKYTKLMLKFATVIKKCDFDRDLLSLECFVVYLRIHFQYQSPKKQKHLGLCCVHCFIFSLFCMQTGLTQLLKQKHPNKLKSISPHKKLEFTSFTLCVRCTVHPCCLCNTSATILYGSLHENHSIPKWNIKFKAVILHTSSSWTESSNSERSIWCGSERNIQITQQVRVMWGARSKINLLRVLQQLWCFGRCP